MPTIKQLPTIAGKVLARLGKLNALEQAESVVEEKIRVEQARRTYERKAAQIKRARREAR